MNTLKTRRNELKLTQRQVAEKIGIVYQLYQKYENGLILPNVKVGIKIAKVLETTVEELYGE